MPATIFKNTILRNLDAETIARLRLHRVSFAVGQTIKSQGHAIEKLIFIEEGMATMITKFAKWSEVSVGMFGYESMIGISALMGTKHSLNEVYTQVAYWGYSTDVALARREFERGARFQRLALEYVQTQLLQAMQSAACNAKHAWTNGWHVGCCFARTE